MSDLKKSKGWNYFQETKFDRNTLPFLHPLRISSPRKSSKDQFLEIPLPEPQQDDFIDLLSKRRSCRSFAELPLDLEELSYILFAAYGVTGRAGFYTLKTAPSAGALYPCELYLQVNRVKSLEPGIYCFLPDNFCLKQIKLKDLSSEVQGACLGQSFVGRAAVNIFISAVFRQNMIKYGHRGLRYILLDAGHIAQNILLGAVSLGLGACPVGAFFDDELNSLIGLDGEEESVLYVCSLGRIKS
ncbi:SagB/ThcOx family dehydrogenase [Desulfonauticus submarinus]